MTTFKIVRLLKTSCLSLAMIAVSATAAPILSDAEEQAGPGTNAASAVFDGGGNTALYSHMRFSGGQHQSVAFRSEDDSIVLGHYAKGPWSKNQFLRAWQDLQGGNGDVVPTVVPIQQSTIGLPEPSTLALFGLGLLGLGILRRQQTRI